MTATSPATSLQQRADEALEALRGLCGDVDLAMMGQLVEDLRNLGDYPRMLRLAEALHRAAPSEPKIRRLQAQALIETGLASVAVPVLEALSAALPTAHPEHLEVQGLLGRAWKQMFFDAADKAAEPAHAALRKAIAAYRQPYEEDPRNTWHGVNLLALLHRARRLGIVVAPELSVTPLARQLVATLQATPPALRGDWFLPTLAEALLGLGDWDAVESHLRSYVARPDVPAFLVASTLRQFSDVWDLEHLDAGGRVSTRGRGLVDLLRARLLTLPRAELMLSPEKVAELQAAPPPGHGQLEAVLGDDGPKTYEWWMAGLKRAQSVAAVRRRLGKRIGTGCLVRAGDLGASPPDELMVLTNYHVVNQAGASPGIRPQDAQVAFEAAEGKPVYDVAEIVWSAPPDRHDASLLRLRTPVVGIEPMTIASQLPEWPVPAGRAAAARVYLVGHPRGGDLAFSFQDNEMLGHEGPPAGRPAMEGVCRVHYRAPTEGGSSGSPVFNDSGWELIALHHMGGQMGMPRLNKEGGSYAANEGISIESIVAAIARSKASTL